MYFSFSEINSCMVLVLFNEWFNGFALCIPDSTPASPFLFPRITSPKKA